MNSDISESNSTNESDSDISGSNSTSEFDSDVSESNSESNDNEDEYIINIKNNIFRCDNYNFTTFFIINKSNKCVVWISSIEIAEYLEYEDIDKAINNFIDNSDTIRYEKLLKKFGPANIKPLEVYSNTKFVNVAGFLGLIRNSNKGTSNHIKKWLKNDLAITLQNYKVHPEQIKIESFYDNNMISDFYRKAVVYIGYIGKINGNFFFKYGLSRHIFAKAHVKYPKIFNKFEIVFIGETDNCEHIKLLFEQDLKALKLHRTYIKYGKEFFTVSTKHPIDYLVNHMKKLIDKNPLPAIAEIRNESKKVEMQIQVISEKNELKKLELHVQLTSNKIKLKELDMQSEKERKK